MKNAKSTKTDQSFIVRKSQILNGKGVYHVSSVGMLLANADSNLIFDYFV